MLATVPELQQYYNIYNYDEITLTALYDRLYVSLNSRLIPQIVNTHTSNSQKNHHTQVFLHTVKRCIVDVG